MQNQEPQQDQDQNRERPYDIIDDALKQIDEHRLLFPPPDPELPDPKGVLWFLGIVTYLSFLPTVWSSIKYNERGGLLYDVLTVTIVAITTGFAFIVNTLFCAYAFILVIHILSAFDSSGRLKALIKANYAPCVFIAVLYDQVLALIQGRESGVWALIDL